MNSRLAVTERAPAGRVRRVAVTEISAPGPVIWAVQRK
jgi:hypothetical protein